MRSDSAQLMDDWWECEAMDEEGLARLNNELDDPIAQRMWIERLYFGASVYELLCEMPELVQGVRVSCTVDSKCVRSSGQLGKTYSPNRFLSWQIAVALMVLSVGLLYLLLGRSMNITQDAAPNDVLAAVAGESDKPSEEEKTHKSDDTDDGGGKKGERDHQKIKDRPFNHARVAPGRVEAVSGIVSLGFDLAGRIRKLAVKEGDKVKTGQIIAELENDESHAHVAKAKAELLAAEAQAKTLETNVEAEHIGAVFDVDRLQAEYAQMSTGARKESVLAAQAAVQQAKAMYDNAETEAKRYSDPDGTRKGAFTESQQANALNNAKAARAALDLAQQRLKELENGYRDEDKKKALAMLERAKADVVRIETIKQSRLNEAKAAVENARARLKLAEVNLEKTVLRSPIDGVVVRKFRYAGQTVGMLPPEIVVTVADMERLQVVASVDEGDYPDIFPGQEVRVTAVAFPGEKFEGTVETVGKEAGEKPFETGEARERVDIKIVETIVRFNKPVPLKLGQRVTAWFKLKDEPKK